MNEKWAYSDKEEGPYFGRFNSRQEVIDAALSDDSILSDAKIWIGKCVELRPENYVDVEQFLEDVQRQMSDNTSNEDDFAFIESGDDIENELQESLTRVFAAWLDKHNLRPTWCDIVDAEHIKINQERRK